MNFIYSPRSLFCHTNELIGRDWKKSTAENEQFWSNHNYFQRDHVEAAVSSAAIRLSAYLSRVTAITILTALTAKTRIMINAVSPIPPSASFTWWFTFGNVLRSCKPAFQSHYAILLEPVIRLVGDACCFGFEIKYFFITGRILHSSRHLISKTAWQVVLINILGLSIKPSRIDWSQILVKTKLNWSKKNHFSACHLVDFHGSTFLAPDWYHVLNKTQQQAGLLDVSAAQQETNTTCCKNDKHLPSLPYRNPIDNDALSLSLIIYRTRGFNGCPQYCEISRPSASASGPTCIAR